MFKKISKKNDKAPKGKNLTDSVVNVPNDEVKYNTVLDKPLFKIHQKVKTKVNVEQNQVISRVERDILLTKGDIKVSPKYYVKSVKRPIKNFILGLIMFSSIVGASLPILYLNPRVAHQVSEFKEVSATINNVTATVAANSKNKSKNFQSNDNNRVFNLSFNSPYLTTNQEFLKNNQVYIKAYPVWLQQQGIEPAAEDAYEQLINFESTDAVLESVYQIKSTTGEQPKPNEELIRILNDDGSVIWNVEKYRSRYEYFLLNIIMNQVTLVGGNSPLAQLNSKFNEKSKFFTGIASVSESKPTGALKWYQFTPKQIYINFIKNIFNNLAKLELKLGLTYDDALSIHPEMFFKGNTGDLTKKFNEYMLLVQSKMKNPEELSSITQLFPNNWIRNRRQASSEKVIELETLNNQLSELKNTQNLIKYGIIPNREIGDEFKIEDFPDIKVGYSYSEDYLNKQVRNIEDFNKKFKEFTDNNLIEDSDRALVFNIDYDSVNRFNPNLNNLKWESDKLEESVDPKWKLEDLSTDFGNLWSNYLKIIPIGFKKYSHYKIKSIIVKDSKVSFEINVYGENLIKTITVTDLDLKTKLSVPKEFK